MGKQYNKVEKRKRRESHNKRKKLALRKGKTAKSAATPAAA